MHTHQRDCVLCIPRKGYDRIAVDIITCAESGRQCFLDLDHVFAHGETGDRDVADATRHTLVGTLIQGSTAALGVPVERKDILTFSDRYRVISSDMNSVVAVTDSYRISARGKYDVIVAVSQRYRVGQTVVNNHLIIVTIADRDVVTVSRGVADVAGLVQRHFIASTVAEGDRVAVSAVVDNNIASTVAEGDCAAGLKGSDIGITGTVAEDDCVAQVFTASSKGITGTITELERVAVAEAAGNGIITGTVAEDDCCAKGVGRQNGIHVAVAKDECVAAAASNTFVKIVSVAVVDRCNLSVLCFGLIPEHSLHVGIGMAITNYVGQKLRRSK